MRSPPRPSRKAARDPGPIGHAPGHLAQVRLGGGLLITAVIVRFLAVLGLLGADTVGALLLLMSSGLFVASGAVSLRDPGRWAWRSRPGRGALLGLLGAEAMAVIGALYVLSGARWAPWQSHADDGLTFLLATLHAALLVVAAGGLLGHIRQLLRPGAALRTLSSGLLVGVIALLSGWAVAVPLGMEWLMICMIPLPPLALAVGMLMIAQRGLAHAQAVAAVERGLLAAGADIVRQEALPGGATWELRLGTASATLHLDDARLPLAVEVTAPVPASLSALRITPRRSSRARGVPTGDVMLDQLVCVEGVSEADAARLLAGQHGALLSVTQGRPGSAVRDGEVCLRAAVGVGSALMVPSSSAQALALESLVQSALHDATDLAAVLTQRATPSAADAAQRQRRPDSAPQREG